jgi:hypothetical protein
LFAPWEPFAVARVELKNGWLMKPNGSEVVLPNEQIARQIWRCDVFCACAVGNCDIGEYFASRLIDPLAHIQHQDGSRLIAWLQFGLAIRPLAPNNTEYFGRCPKIVEFPPHKGWSYHNSRSTGNRTTVSVKLSQFFIFLSDLLRSQLRVISSVFADHRLFVWRLGRCWR